jgi:hypothetical protein
MGQKNFFSAIKRVDPKHSCRPRRDFDLWGVGGVQASD